MTTQEIKIGTTLKSKCGTYEMVVTNIYTDGADVTCYAISPCRKTGEKFITNAEIKYYNQ